MDMKFNSISHLDAEFDQPVSCFLIVDSYADPYVNFKVLNGGYKSIITPIIKESRIVGDGLFTFS